MSIACFEWIQAFVIDPRWVQFDLKLIQNVIISSHLFIATLMHFYIPIQLLYHLYLKLIHVYNVLDNEFAPPFIVFHAFYVFALTGV